MRNSKSLCTTLIFCWRVSWFVSVYILSHPFRFLSHFFLSFATIKIFESIVVITCSDFSNDTNIVNNSRNWQLVNYFDHVPIHAPILISHHKFLLLYRNKNCIGLCIYYYYCLWAWENQNVKFAIQNSLMKKLLYTDTRDWWHLL